MQNWDESKVMISPRITSCNSPRIWNSVHGKHIWTPKVAHTELEMTRTWGQILLKQGLEKYSKTLNSYRGRRRQWYNKPGFTTKEGVKVQKFWKSRAVVKGSWSWWFIKWLISLDEFCGFCWLSWKIGGWYLRKWKVSQCNWQDFLP